jgi:hypothetical protein
MARKGKAFSWDEVADVPLSRMNGLGYCRKSRPRMNSFAIGQGPHWLTQMSMRLPSMRL